MRLNLGIRRCLAPLLHNNKQKNLLMHSLLLTIGGSPFLYYGDEIGMGDNILLPNRNGVRTPTQLDTSPNAGFSSDCVGNLYVSVNNNSVYGYAQVNIASQTTEPDPFLHCIKRMIARRKEHAVFGVGNFRWGDFGDRAVSAYLRDYQDESYLIINNLSNNYIPLKLPESFKGAVDIIYNQAVTTSSVKLEPYQFGWLLKNC